MVVFGKLIDMILVAFGIILIMIFIFPLIFENSESFVRICNFAPAFCPDSVFAEEESVFIKYFNVVPSSGNQVKVQWLLLKPNDGEELDYEITYNNSDDKVPKIAGGPITQKSGYNERVIQFDDGNFEPHTIKIHVSKEDYPNLDSQEILWEFMPNYQTSIPDFLLLNVGVISSDLLVKEKRKVTIPKYNLEENLRIVGFNKDTAVGTCGGTREISAPKECEGQTCLCLCEDKKGDCSSVERLCFAYEDVDYFISLINEERALHHGDKVTYPGIRDTTYLVLEGRCGLNKWNSRDLSVEKIIEEGKTFIKIEEV